MYFIVTKMYCSIKLPKLDLLVILNQEIESGVYAKNIKSINRSSNKTVFFSYTIYVTRKSLAVIKAKIYNGI